MTPEAVVKKQVRTQLDALGAWYFMPVGGPFGKSGIFDFCVVFRGRFIGIETKKDCKTPPTGLQSRNARLAKASQALVLLIHNENVERLSSILQEIPDDHADKLNEQSIWPFDGITL